jgi:hypothetical protein
VLTNLGYATPVSIASAIFAALHPDVHVAATPAPGEDPAVTARAREWFDRFATGRIDRTQLAPQMDALLTPELIAGAKASFAPLGEPVSFVYSGSSTVDGFAVTTYVATFASVTMKVTMSLTADGKIGGYLVRRLL